MPTLDWMPNLKDVGDLLRARTKDDNGTEVGTFTPETRPTDEEVEPLINKAVADVALRTGSDIPPATWGDARRLAAVRTAMHVELSYYPEQVGTTRSIYPQLKDMWDTDLKALIQAITFEGGAPLETGAPMKPVYSFPRDEECLPWS